MESSGQLNWIFDADLAQLLREEKIPYLMINVITKRAKQLKELAGRPLAFPANGSLRAADIAAAEIYEGKLKIAPRRKKTTESKASPLVI